MKRLTANNPVSDLFPIVDWLTKHGLQSGDITGEVRKRHFCTYFCIERSDVEEILLALAFLMGVTYNEK